jgi:hypothetical protein
MKMVHLLLTTITQFNNLKNIIMKTIKKIGSILILSIFVFACSKDDEPIPVVQKDQFLKKIISTSTTTPSINQTITFDYDTQNRISNYIVTKTGASLSHNITYNTNGLISSINRVATGTTTANTTFNFTYNTNGILTQLTIPGTPITTMNFTYNATQKKYIGDDGAGYIVEIRLNDSGNIIQFVNSTENSVISYNTNSGIFKNSTNCLQLFLTHFFSSDGSSKYIAQLFSNKEITAIEGATTTLTTTTTRNTNNLISQIKYGTSASTIFTANITYEERNL